MKKLKIIVIVIVCGFFLYYGFRLVKFFDSQEFKLSALKNISLTEVAIYLPAELKDRNEIISRTDAYIAQNKPDERGDTHYLKSGEYKYTHELITQSGFMGSQTTLASDLYVQHGAERKKLLSNIDYLVEGLDDILLLPSYQDKRGNIYIATDSGTLYVIFKGEVIGRMLNVASKGVYMYSDLKNTYILLPKQSVRDVMVGQGDSREEYFSREYKVNF